MEKTYEYTVTFLKYGKMQRMTVEAESREHAREVFQARVDDMQAFTESGSEVFEIISIR
jgi:hypothetical protein